MRRTCITVVLFVLFIANAYAQTITYPIARQLSDTVYPAVAKNLAPEAIGEIGLQVPKPFSKATALRMLFPANYYRSVGLSEDLDLVVWKCVNCGWRTYEGWIGEEGPYVFPADRNITETGDVLKYTDESGVKHIIFSFATHEYQEFDFMRNGRFYSVGMGLAWFKEVNNKWELTAFNPCLGYYGAFQTLPNLKLIKLGKNNYGCYIENGNGGPGQVYTYDLYVFGIVDNVIKKVLQCPKVERSNTPSSRWGCVLKPWKGMADSLFMPVSIELQGTYFKETPDTTYDWTDHVPEMTKAQLAKDSLDFKVVRKYQFSKGRYRKVGSKLIELEPAKH
jgi:hypothetical protein